jgi:hypothetical protein
MVSRAMKGSSGCWWTAAFRSGYAAGRYFADPKKSWENDATVGSNPDFWSVQARMEAFRMGRQLAGVIYVLAMAAVIVGVDFAFFRNRFWERLMVNIGIVLIFAAFYFRFLRQT